MKGYVLGKKSPAAGIILIKYHNGIPKLLGLMDNGEFDLPKGAIETGETIIDGAFRECEEESGITLMKFPWGLKYFSVNHVTLFVAVTEEEPVITPNPATQELEHQYAKWMDLELDDIKQFKPYLQPAILWAKNIVEGGL